MAILKFDKTFSEISQEVGTKTVKQCIEFYYLWKKVMSDSARKKWRIFKKNRLLDDTDSIEQNLRSSTSDGSKTTTAANARDDDDSGKLNRDESESTLPLDDDNNNLDAADNENGCDDVVMSELDINNNSLSAGKKTNGTLGKKEKSPSPTASTGGRIQKQCDKCDMVFFESFSKSFKSFF